MACGGPQRHGPRLPGLSRHAGRPVIAGAPGGGRHRGRGQHGGSHRGQRPRRLGQRGPGGDQVVHQHQLPVAEQRGRRGTSSSGRTAVTGGWSASAARTAAARASPSGVASRRAPRSLWASRTARTGPAYSAAAYTGGRPGGAGEGRARWAVGRARRLWQPGQSWPGAAPQPAQRAGSSSSRRLSSGRATDTAAPLGRRLGPCVSLAARRPEREAFTRGSSERRQWSANCCAQLRKRLRSVVERMSRGREGGNPGTGCSMGFQPSLVGRKW